MTNLKILKLMMIIFVTVSLIGCSSKDDNKIINGYLSAEAKTLSSLVEKFQLVNEENRVRVDGIDRDYKELNGNIHVLNIYAGDEIDKTILYNSNFTIGSVRVVLVKPNGEVEDIVKGNGQGSTTVKVPIGKSYIKLIGSEATGNLKINFPTVTNEEQKMLANFNDGEYIFYKNNGTKGDNLSIRLFRVNVLNKKVDKIAKVVLRGKSQDGKLVVPYDNDGWGNSGVAEIFIPPNSNLPDRIDIKVQSKSFKSTLWGIDEGAYPFTGDENLPDFLDGL